MITFFVYEKEIEKPFFSTTNGASLMVANENVGYASGQTGPIQGRNGLQIEVEMNVKLRSKWTPNRGRNGHQNEVETVIRPEATPSSFSSFAPGRPAGRRRPQLKKFWQN